VPPELAVSLAAGPQPASVGDVFDYAVSIVNNSIGSADAATLRLTLPAGVQYVGFKVTRGPGCTPAGQVVTCFLDFFPGKLADVVRVTAKVTEMGALTATASVSTIPGDSNGANNTATLTLALDSTAASSAPAGTVIGDYTTPPKAKKKPAKKAVRDLQAVPHTGSVVKPRFLVVAAAPKGVKAVSFVLDGRSACVDRARPFTCALKARRGWHTVRVRAGAGKATTVRLRVAG
jgi:uncharacterized repeat protein (TIGR01451 family)